MNVQEPFAPRLPRLIGREAIISKIRQAVGDTSGISYAYYLEGSGGIGKTRLLEEVAAIVRETPDRALLLSDIVDLYHADYHSLGHLRQAIINSLDPDDIYFQDYKQQRDKYESQRDAGIGGGQLETMRQALDEAFLDGYRQLAQDRRVVLRFDTLELLTHESDSVQQVLGMDPDDTAIVHWLRKTTPKLPNTVTLLAGRKRPRIESLLQKSFAEAREQNDVQYEKLDIDKFSYEETVQYLESLCHGTARGAELAEIVQPGQDGGEPIRLRIHYLCQGKPILLTLVTDLMLTGQTLHELFPPTGETDNADRQDTVGPMLIDQVLQLSDPLGAAIKYLAYARKGLDEELLVYLTGWMPAKASGVLSELENYAFVKKRPGEDLFVKKRPGEDLLFFLHDEVYDLFDKHYLSYRDTSTFESIATYYRDKIANIPQQDRQKNGTRQRYERLLTESLFYELMRDAEAGYFNCYVPWDEDAIRSHAIGLDMRLRDEALRFLNRYVDETSPIRNRHVAEKLNRERIDRDCAVRWVIRYHARGQYDRAINTAQTLINSSNPAFGLHRVEDPVYKAALLTALSNSRILAGHTKPDPKIDLEMAIGLLSELPEDQAEQAWRKRTLGVAHNLLGYLYRTRGDYGKAHDSYCCAIPFFESPPILSEQANTLNGLAYLQALLGRAKLAKPNIERAIKIRRELGIPYPLAISINTRGIIVSICDDPEWGTKLCREALGICTEIGEQRGIGLARNGLGLALRKRGDQWKYDRYTQEEAVEFFTESEAFLKQAEQIFSRQVKEPIRLWEAYNELGSLYCDWAWLEQKRNDAVAALKLYGQSITAQQKALAQAGELAFQKLDSLDDLAQVHADLSFLLLSYARPGKPVIVNGEETTPEAQRQQAESYNGQILEAIPNVFHLQQGRGFENIDEPGSSYWQSLAKAWKWRGTWLFRDIEYGNLAGRDPEKVLTEATKYYLLSLAYAEKFWPQSYNLERGLEALGHFWHENRRTTSWVEEQLDLFQAEYGIDLDIVREATHGLLGIQWLKQRSQLATNSFDS